MDALAGQTLLVDLEDSDGVVQVSQPGATSGPLPSVDFGAPGDWMNVLPKAGAYEIAIRTASKKPYGLRITLLDPHDPRLDPGIAPDRVSLDLGPLGGKAKLALAPFQPVLNGDVDDGWPANLFVLHDRIEFRIMSLDGLKKRQANNAAWLAQLARLEAALRPGGKLVAPELLPPGYPDAELAFGARVEYIDEPAFRAIRYIGQFAQDVATPSNPLTYILFGITRDSKSFILMRAEISHPSLAKTAAIVQGGPKLKAQQAEAARRLAAAPPESFQPGLGQLDGIARSLRLP